MARNQRRRAQEALFSPAPSTTPLEEEKAVERTETQKTCFVQDRLIPKDELKEIEKAFEESATKNGVCVKSSDDIISERYGFGPEQTDIPKLLYAILCETVRRRV